MLIWLGKNFLGQTDKVENDTKIDQDINISFVEKTKR